ncbi:MAG: hypothetical protein IH884_12595 [Myxococcales bacterium]|nr:hypothetical protein [Myxococcales bacterium]
MVEAGQHARPGKVAFHPAQQCAIQTGRLQAGRIEVLPALIAEPDSPGSRLELAHEERRLLDLDLTPKLTQLDDEAVLVREEAHALVEGGAQLRVQEPNPFVAPMAVVVQHQPEGSQGRRP